MVLHQYTVDKCCMVRAWKLEKEQQEGGQLKGKTVLKQQQE